MASEKEPARAPVRVEVVGINIPYYDMVMLIVKFVLAAIPAAILAGIVLFFVYLVLGAIGMRFG